MFEVCSFFLHERRAGHPFCSLAQPALNNGTASKLELGMCCGMVAATRRSSNGRVAAAPQPIRGASALQAWLLSRAIYLCAAQPPAMLWMGHVPYTMSGSGRRNRDLLHRGSSVLVAGDWRRSAANQVRGWCLCPTRPATQGYSESHWSGWRAPMRAACPTQRHQFDNKAAFHRGAAASFMTLSVHPALLFTNICSVSCSIGQKPSGRPHNRNCIAWSSLSSCRFQ